MFDRLDFDVGFNVAPYGLFSNEMQTYRMLQNESIEEIRKALTTGDGIVPAGATGGTALRVQFLHGGLERVSFEQDDAKAMKLLPKPKVGSTAIEWTTQNQYGGPGDGFVPETGSDGAFNVTASDDAYRRMVRNVRYLATKREVGIVAQEVRNIEDPMTASEEGATLELVGKANLGVYFGDSLKSVTQYDGLIRQIQDWVTDYPQDVDIMIDAGGQPIDSEMIEAFLTTNKMKFGNGQLLLQSSIGYGDTQSLLFPNLRGDLGSQGIFGVDKRQFRGPYGTIRLEDDPMLRPNQPLVVEGTGLTGKPRTGSGDAGSIGWASTPWSACAAASAGTVDYWRNVTLNTATSAIAAPALPVSTGNNNASKRNPAGDYYYAASVVFNGLESLPWVFGAASADTVASATAVTITSQQIVSMTLLASAITGLGSTYPRNRVKVRIYRYGGPGVSAPTSTQQFDFLFETGWPTSGNTAAHDNGFNIPGSDNAFLITEKKGKAVGWYWAQLLELMKRPLPNLMLADQFGLLMFGCPILPVPRHHIWIRNIGRRA